MNVSVASDERGSPFEEVLAAAGSGVRAAMERVEDQLQRRGGSHGGALARHSGRTLSAGGKRLRPLLVFVCGAPGADAGASEALVRAGVAVELVHMATLVHDDVVDAAMVRRGQPTVYSEDGEAAATTTGDFLFASAFALLRDGGDGQQVRVLSEACLSLAKGELAQREDAYSRSVSVDRYLERSSLKTASLFAAACEMGSLAAGHESTEAAALGTFGHGVGVAFQLLDDVLDVVGPPERTGKARGGDLLEGTVTMPLLLAAQEDPELEVLDLAAIGSRSEAERVCDRIAATSAIAETRRRAESLVADAIAQLDGRIGPRRAKLLTLVADRIVNRYS
jgi:geranylgeranyl pyrophosphate synthase